MEAFTAFVSEGFYAYILVFGRVIALFLFLPGFGERFLIMQLKVLMAFVITLVITPLALAFLPKLPVSLISFMLLFMGEVAVGIFMSFVTRLFLYALETAGSIISHVTGLSNAMVANPISAQQASILSGFLGLSGLLIIFSLDLHHYFIMGLVRSYEVFVSGAMPPLDDFSQKFVELFSLTFKISVAFAAPFLVANLVFFMGMGLLTRLVTQIQVFFVAMPLQILIGFAILYISLTALFMWFVQEMSAVLPSIWGSS